MNKPLRFSGQDFKTLKQVCLQKKVLFEDDTFPATVESLGYKELGHKSNKVKNIVWQRPKVGLGRGQPADRCTGITSQTTRLKKQVMVKLMIYE